ncbi:hypothetical protein [Microbacterium sp.]|uniref:hypothetical protein n=1 Tax=Microbacterium sp. TaxID=51671 RepID=UPI003F6E760D
MTTAHAVRRSTDAIRVPAVLPVIAMTISADGTMTVAVDGTPFEPPRFGPPWARASFAEVIDRVLLAHGSPVRIVVYEADGTVFTDIITRPLQGSVALTAPPQVRDGGSRAPAEPRAATAALIDATPLIEPPRVVYGEEGFLPGEEVALAIIVRHIKASADGSARASLEPGLCRVTADGEIVLVGRISGTCVFGIVT